ncbi:hypothetical protein [Streptomyces sp. H39-S7]|uniref:hypothetical protein n=1 Tax=Streptomyces sp. H39-S7 TaxID=3004357 RepID=UPI0022AE5C3D|nr:hypothetical protein [Streptomyces sp. H39-S7]MCZ4120207.1 hypothetical protein [Streptomyces sp. H39-S7]
MSARHTAPDRDRLGAVLTASWAALHLARIAALGLAVHQQQIINDTRTGHTASAPDTEPPTV